MNTIRDVIACFMYHDGRVCVTLTNEGTSSNDAVWLRYFCLLTCPESLTPPVWPTGSQVERLSGNHEVKHKTKERKEMIIFFSEILGKYYVI